MAEGGGSSPLSALSESLFNNGNAGPSNTAKEDAHLASQELLIAAAVTESTAVETGTAAQVADGTQAQAHDAEEEASEAKPHDAITVVQTADGEEKPPLPQKRKATTQGRKAPSSKHPRRSTSGPKKSAKDKKWEAPFVLTDPKSPLTSADLRVSPSLSSGPFLAPFSQLIKFACRDAKLACPLGHPSPT